jgi:hypothetical protein
MTKHVASRTLVKSPPELWAECSDAASLARHLDQFGDIKITRLDPETAVAWEGERARGTVRIEPAGWGTKVILTAVAVEDERQEKAPAVVEVVEPVVEVVDSAVGVPDAPEAADTESDTSPPRRRRFPRLFRFKRPPTATELIAEPEPEATAEPEPAPEPELEPTHEAGPAQVPTLEEIRGDTATDTTGDSDTAGETASDTATSGDTATATATATEMTEAALTAALDSLGQAHHRPYSRA